MSEGAIYEFLFSIFSFFSFSPPLSPSLDHYSALDGIERFLEVSIRLCHKYGESNCGAIRVGPGWCVDSAIMRRERERETLLYTQGKEED